MNAAIPANMFQISHICVTPFVGAINADEFIGDLIQGTVSVLDLCCYMFDNFSANTKLSHIGHPAT